MVSMPTMVVPFRLSRGCGYGVCRFSCWAEYAGNRKAPASHTHRHAGTLREWGYPYVFDGFRFHMTLTGPTEPQDRERIERALHCWFGPILADAVAVEQLALFTEASAGAPFLVHAASTTRQAGRQATEPVGFVAAMAVMRAEQPCRHSPNQSNMAVRRPPNTRPCCCRDGFCRGGSWASAVTTGCGDCPARAAG